MTVALVLVAACLLPQGVLQISNSYFDLVPPRPFSLGGYTARGSKPVEQGGDPLYARILKIKNNETTVVIVSCDLLTIPESLAREVKAKIPTDVHLFLAATHTHSAPDSQMLNDRMTFAIPGIAKFDPSKLEWYANTISRSINGILSTYQYKSDSINADFAHVDANRGRRQGANPDQLALHVWSGQLESPFRIWSDLFFWYTAHATIVGPENNKTHADWPGQARNISNSSPVLVGAIGDVSPKAEGDIFRVKINQFWLNMYARMFSAETEKPRRTIHYQKPKLDWASEPIQLPIVSPNPEFAKLNKVPIPLANSVITRFAPTQANISAFRIGKICVVGVPGEPTSELGRRIRNYGRNLGFDFVLVTSHVNGWIGYILEAEDYARGGYEASLAFHGPETAQRVFEASARALQRLAYPNRGVKSVSGVTSRQ